MPDITTRPADTTTDAGGVGAWARDVTGPAPVVVREPALPGERRRLRALGAAMVASPLAMTAWFLVEPAVLPREEPEVFLGSIAAAPDRYLAATLMVALAGALAIPAALGLYRLLRDRTPRLAVAIGVVTVLSGLGLWAQVGFRSVVQAMLGDGVTDSAVTSYTAFQSSSFFDGLLLPGLAFGGAGTLLLLGTLVRTRVVPLWVPALLVAGAVLASGEFPDVVTVGGAFCGAVANLRLARALLATSRGA